MIKLNKQSTMEEACKRLAARELAAKAFQKKRCYKLLKKDIKKRYYFVDYPDMELLKLITKELNKDMCTVLEEYVYFYDK